MAQIYGLLEMQNALAEINQILKKVEQINFFLEITNPSNEYYLSFNVPIKSTEEVSESFSDASLNEENLNSFTETSIEETSQNNPSKNSKKDKSKAADRRRKAKTHITYSVPIICDNKDDLYQFIYNYKNQEKERVLALSNEYRIVLDENDKAILGISE